MAETDIKQLLTEGVKPLHEAFAEAGLPCDKATAWRRATLGIKRKDGTVVRLAHVRQGRLLTSVGAVVRFLAAVSAPVEADPTLATPRSPTVVNRAAAAANAELIAGGF